MASSPRPRSYRDRALHARLRHGLRKQGRCAGNALLALKAGLASFGLMLHEVKVRLIEFGRLAALSLQRLRVAARDLRLPRLYPYCGQTRDGRFIVKHKTEGKRLTRKLTALRQEA